jgi:FKBP-type peptidyl-prolyl cis-trans isomerase FkpA
VNLATTEDTVSYIVGHNMGTQFKEQKAPVRPQALASGVDDAIRGAPSKFNPEQTQAIMMAFQQKMMAEAKKTADSVGAQNEKFLADNSTKEGVKTTASGLQYKPIREGKGARPKATSQVTVHYKGSLVNGTPFDSSYGGAPIQFRLNEVITGWGEGLQLMTPGSKYQFWIPGKLAYGDQGRPPVIGPNETLVFDIELVSFR